MREQNNGRKENRLKPKIWETLIGTWGTLNANLCPVLAKQLPRRHQNGAPRAARGGAPRRALQGPIAFSRWKNIAGSSIPLNPQMHTTYPGAAQEAEGHVDYPTPRLLPIRVRGVGRDGSPGCVIPRVGRPPAWKNLHKRLHESTTLQTFSEEIT